MLEVGDKRGTKYQTATKPCEVRPGRQILADAVKVSISALTRPHQVSGSITHAACCILHARQRYWWLGMIANAIYVDAQVQTGKLHCAT